MPEISFEDLVAGLRGWATDQAPHVRAAVELLSWHETWLRRRTFRETCISHRGGQIAVRWRDARTFSDRVTTGGLNAPRASSSEAAILDLAVALGEDRFGLGNFGHAHRREAARAFAAACGQTLEAQAPVHNHPDFIPCDETCPAREAGDVEVPQ